MIKKTLFCIFAVSLILSSCSKKEEEEWENPMSLNTSEDVAHKIDIQSRRYCTLFNFITGGTGVITAESSNPKAITAFVEDRILYWTPIALGESTITIEDEEGQKKYLDIIVEGDDSLPHSLRNYAAIGEQRIYDIKEHEHDVYLGTITSPDIVNVEINEKKKLSIKFLKRGRTIVHVLGENPEGRIPFSLFSETFYIYEPNEFYRNDEKVDYDDMMVGQLINPIRLLNADGIFTIENSNEGVATATILRSPNNYPEVKFDFLKIGNTTIHIKDGSGRFVKFNINVKRQ